MLATSRRIFAAATPVLVAALALAPSASGALDPLATGQTELRLNRGLYQLLKEEGVHLSRSAPGRVQGRVATLSAGGDLLDPTTGKGSVNLEGGFRFRAGRRQVALGELVLDTTKRVLAGKIGGERLRLASMTSVTDTRDGFGVDIAVKGLKLTRRAAKILNRKLGLDGVIRGGRSFAEASSSIQPGSVTVSSGSTVLVGNAETFAKLKSLEVEIIPFEAATVLSANPPTFSFPLLTFGPAVPLDLSSSGVESETGLRLTRHEGLPPAPVMSLLGLSVSFESKTVSADVSVQPLSPDGGLFGTTPIATLDTAPASTLVDPSTRTITLSNVSATIDQFLADRLNNAFAKPQGKAPQFAAGDPLGTITVTVQAP